MSADKQSARALCSQSRIGEKGLLTTVSYRTGYGSICVPVEYLPPPEFLAEGSAGAAGCLAIGIILPVFYGVYLFAFLLSHLRRWTQKPT